MFLRRHPAAGLDPRVHHGEERDHLEVAGAPGERELEVDHVKAPGPLEDEGLRRGHRVSIERVDRDAAVGPHPGQPALPQVDRRDHLEDHGSTLAIVSE